MADNSHSQKTNNRGNNQEGRKAPGRGRGSGAKQNKPKRDERERADTRPRSNSKNQTQDNRKEEEEDSHIQEFHRPPSETPPTDPKKSSNLLPQPAEDADSDDCPICIEPLQYWGLGKCNHRKICALCAVRRRMLYKQNECLICRQPLEEIIITDDPEKPWGNYDKTQMKFDKELKVYYPEALSSYHAKIQGLRENHCPYCEKTFGVFKELNKHVQQEHKLHFCDICLEHRKVFLQEQKLYAQKDLGAHRRFGDKDTQIKHEKCEFCNKFYFDQDALYDHLHKQHETCFICEKDGIKYQYYKDYSALEQHFKSAHHLCEDPKCRQERFKVFRTALELQMHSVEHLQGSKSQTKAAREIKLDFSVRNSASRPIESENRETEEKAPTVPKEEEFPTLENSGPAPARATILGSSWGASGANRATGRQEAFPALGGSGSAPTSNPNWGRSQNAQPTTPARGPALNRDFNLNDSGEEYPTLPPSSGKLTASASSSAWGSGARTARNPPRQFVVEEPSNRDVIMRTGMANARGTRKSKKQVQYATWGDL